MVLAWVALGVGCGNFFAGPDDPPSLSDTRAWRWVASAPGASIYVSEIAKSPSAAFRTVWLAFRFPSSSVSVNADLLELWEVDCQQHQSRRVAGPLRGDEAHGVRPIQRPSGASSWQHDSGATPAGKALDQLCAETG
jgi:hypothetical protein